jgi:hypothetical protein
MGMQHCDDRFAFWINHKDYSVHALAIGRGNAVSQPSKLPTTDHK